MKCFVSAIGVSGVCHRLMTRTRREPALRSDRIASHVRQVQVVEIKCGWERSLFMKIETARRESSPWVTKLPKFLPTMQCHVAPFLESN